MTAQLREVSKQFGRKAVLSDITLDLQHGVIGLLGPNGAGKTTLLRLLATVLSPTSGQISVAGHDVTGSHPERVAARRRIGYLPQEVVFPRGMTSIGFLDYIAVLKEWDIATERYAEVRRVLDLVGLGDRSSTKVRALSGGQRRRLAIAQSLLGNPDLLILDEPTTGLDPEQRAGLRGILSRTSGTVLISTHQTEDVSALCDRVIVLDGGTVRFDGTVPELLYTADGRVYEGPEPTVGSLQTWRTGSGRIRSIGGDPPACCQPVEPTVEDAYLLLRTEPEGASR